jgi:hypothetical protein
MIAARRATTAGAEVAACCARRQTGSDSWPIDRLKTHAISRRMILFGSPERVTWIH